MLKGFRSVAQKFLVPTVSVVILLLILLCSITIYKNYKTQEALLHSKGLGTTSFVAKISISYLVNYDLTALESFITELVKDKDIIYAGFYGEDGKVLAQSGEELDPQNLMVFEQALKDADDKQYGKFRLAYRTDQLKLAARRTAIEYGILMLITAAILIGTIILIAKSITKQINHAAQIARRIAMGDLSSSIEAQSKDEIGQLMMALSDMNKSLVNIVGQVRGSTDMIVTASNRIAEGNLDLSSRTEKQANALEKTAVSMEELTVTVKQNADNAHQANGLAHSASEVVMKGGNVVSQVVDTMNSINGSSKKIVDIISVIDGISFQTNILALNAAVEAARAGEQGRGFAVVATEVRNLAQRSAAAAKEIKTLIGESVEKVQIGARQVGDAGATMQEIVASIQHVTGIMSEITIASQEQTAGIEQINLAITNMDEVTKQNSTLVEEAATAAQSLQDQAKDLSKLVSMFTLAHEDEPDSREGQHNAVALEHMPSQRRPSTLRTVMVK